jgi:uncharacterized repeat protein (TIGR03803 family)
VKDVTHVQNNVPLNATQPTDNKRRILVSDPSEGAPRQETIFTLKLSPSARSTLLKAVCICGLVCAATAIALAAPNLTTLLNFDRTDGANPHTSLIQGVDGYLYGTTVSGGAGGPCAGDADGCGTVFKISQTGTLTTIHSFCSQINCPDGANPLAGLAQGTDGNFYGTTSQGGDYNGGTIFKITPAGVITTLYSFDGTHGNDPEAGLVQASGGNFYGTTKMGGSHGSGVVFRITPAGTLTTLYSFCAQNNCSDGSLPSAGLVQANDGNLYGTTAEGGTVIPAVGTVFKITLGGILTTLHSFNGNDGGYPDATFVQGTDGYLYGTTSSGGYGGYGTVFKMTLSGTLATLHSFSGYSTDGGAPYAGFVQATDGNFYGTTERGGAHDSGTVFEITPAGRLTILYSFCSHSDCMDGDSPYATLVQATNGSLYGTTRQPTNCTSSCGTIFRLSMGLSPFVETQPTSGKVGAKVIILGNNLTNATSVTFNGKAATFRVVSSAEITTIVPSDATTGKVRVKTPSGTLTSNVNFRVTPTISSFSPTSATVGTSVAIAGDAFKGATSVTLGGVQATSFAVDSYSQITATVPTGAKTGKIRISTPGGTATSAETFTVTM